MKFIFSNCQTSKQFVAYAKTANEVLKGIDNKVPGIYLDWSLVTVVDPVFAVTQASLIQVANNHEIQPLTAKLPGEEAFRTLAGIGFFGFLFDRNEHFVENPEDYFPLEQFNRADRTLVSELAQYFCERLPLIGDKIDRVEATLDELMSNVEKHSGSPIGGFIAGEYLPGTKHLQFAINDVGVSIPGHLSKLPRYQSGFSDAALIKEAFKEGVTGTEGQVPRRHFGSGLPYIRGLTESVGGSLRVYSRRGLASLKDNELSVEDVEASYPGTLIVIDWPAQ